MTILFSEKPRTRTRPKEGEESNFDFYDSHDSVCFDSYRRTINNWIGLYPEFERANLVAAMQSGDVAYDATLLEILTYVMLRRATPKVSVHPELEHTGKTPDFFAENLHHQDVYVEVTTANLSKSELGKVMRQEQLEQNINSLEFPKDIGISLQVKRVGLRSLSKKFLRSELYQNYKSLDIITDLTNAPKNVIKHDGWEIVIQFYRLNYDREYGIIQVNFGGVKTLSTIEDYRKILIKKSSRYGDLNAPYIIVVSSNKHSFQPDYQRLAFDSLYGTEAISYSLETGKTRNIRNDDGFFGSLKLPKNENVSAVVFFADIGLQSLEKRPPIIFFNPFAKYGLTHNTWPESNFLDYVAQSNITNIEEVMPFQEGWRESPWKKS